APCTNGLQNASVPVDRAAQLVAKSQQSTLDFIWFDGWNWIEIERSKETNCNAAIGSFATSSGMINENREEVIQARDLHAEVPPKNSCSQIISQFTAAPNT
ncbi:MAG: hypothetical protein KBT59_11455, partial [Sphingomonadales bacterium]|nr:hypothetical protein [Sphingomonadales bacterium]